jgi:hypothetical protein
VTIGSGQKPHKDALLDVNQGKGTNHNESEKGLLLPRVALTAKSLALPLTEHVAGMVVYNTGTSATSVDPENRVYPGFYYNTGTRWEQLLPGTGRQTANWFYMPSIVIDVSKSDVFFRDLYLEYRKQFEDSENGSTPANSPLPGTTLVKSDGAPDRFTYIYESNELWYYVTGYDAEVFSGVSIDESGVLEYTVDASKVTDATYMNIVFVVK